MLDAVVPALQVVERPLQTMEDPLQIMHPKVKANTKIPADGRSLFMLPDFRLGAMDEKGPGYTTHPVCVGDVMSWEDTVDGPVGRYRQLFDDFVGKLSHHHEAGCRDVMAVLAANVKGSVDKFNAEARGDEGCGGGGGGDSPRQGDGTGMTP